MDWLLLEWLTELTVLDWAKIIGLMAIAATWSILLIQRQRRQRGGKRP